MTASTTILRQRRSRNSSGNAKRSRLSKIVASANISATLVAHLQSIGKLGSNVKTVDLALEKLLDKECCAFADHMDAADIYPSAALGFGADFVVRSFEAILTKSSKAARAAIASLLRELRAEMHERIANAQDFPGSPESAV